MARDVQRGDPARLAGAAPRSHDPAPALLPRPVAAVLRGDRHRADDRGGRRAVLPARRGRQLEVRLRARGGADGRAEPVPEARDGRDGRGADAAERRRARDGDQEAATSAAVQRRLDVLGSEIGARVDRARPSTGRRDVRRSGDAAGDRRVRGPSCRTAERAAGSGGSRCRSTTAQEYATRCAAHGGRRARRSRRRRCWRRRSRAAATCSCPTGRARTSRSAGRDYRHDVLHGRRAGRRPTTVRLFAPVPGARRERRRSS